MIHNEYAHENLRINRQDWQKVTFHGFAYPKEISHQYIPATHTEAVHCQGVLLEVFNPCLWPLKASGSTLGAQHRNNWRKSRRQPANPDSLETMATCMCVLIYQQLELYDATHQLQVIFTSSPAPRWVG